MATPKTHCEVEVDLYRGEFRYREVRYSGDQTARWISMTRAAKLVGLTRLRELMAQARVDATPREWLDIRIRYYPASALATLEFASRIQRDWAVQLLTARGMSGLESQAGTYGKRLNFVDYPTALTALTELVESTLKTRNLA